MIADCTVVDSMVASCTVARCSEAECTVAGCSVACSVAGCSVAGCMVAYSTVAGCTVALFETRSIFTMEQAGPADMAEQANSTFTVKLAHSTLIAELIYQSADDISSRPEGWVEGPATVFKPWTRWVGWVVELEQVCIKWVEA